MSGYNHAIADENDTFTFYAYFRNYSTGALESPSTVTFSYRTPAQTEAQGTTTAAITPTSTGYYIVNLALTVAGLWRGEFRATGGGVVDTRVLWTVEVKRSPVRV